jgi:subtilisin family serine protease
MEPMINIFRRTNRHAALIGLTFFWVWGIVLWTGGTGGAQPLPAFTRSAYAPGEILVKYQTGNRAAASEFHQFQWGTRTLKFLASAGVHRIRLPEGMSVPEALERFRQDPLVAYAEPNYLRHLSLTPNDPDYSSLWGLATINAPGAWDVDTNCVSVVVAVIDSGADYTHSDLAANIWVNTGEIPDNNIDDDANGKIDDTRGWDFVSEDNDPMDANGHGTHVAGTIGAVGNNALGVAGLCWAARIMLLKAFDDAGDATVADIVEAMEYARGNGARIVNASYSGSEFSQAENDAIAQLNSDGILFVAAAGNDGVDNDQTPSYPAGYGLPNIIAVAASNAGDLLAAFSDFGRSTVDVAAPGVSVLSTYLYNDYAVESGTSMAAPHVSGLAALVWSSNPGLTAAQVKGRILDGVDRIPALEGFIFTAGRINADNSVRNIPAPPSGFAAAGVSGGRIDVSWDDNYSGAVSVKIERRQSGTPAFAEIATVGPGVSVYQDTSVQAAATYDYRARGVNSDNASIYSAVASATAAAPPSGGGGGGGGGACFIASLLGD